MHDIEIIDIASVVPAPQVAFHEAVHLIQQNVAEQLRGYVAYRQPHILRGVEQALRGRESVPVRLLSQHDAVAHRVAEKNHPYQIVDQPSVEPVAPPSAVSRHLAPVRIELPHQHSVEHPPVYAHEIASQVEFEHIGRLGVVPRAASQVVFETPNPHEHPLAHAARIAVVNHAGLEHRGNVVVQQAAHHPVCERRGENLAFDGLRDETKRRFRFVGPVRYAVAEFYQVVFEIEFETQLAFRVPLVLARVEIGTEQVAQQFVSLLFHSLDALFLSLRQKLRILGHSARGSRKRGCYYSAGSRSWR